MTPRSRPAIVFFSSLCLVVGGCASNTVPAHAVRIDLEIDGSRTSGVVVFPEHDPEAHHTSGDDSCDLFSGNCGEDSPSLGRAVSGDLPLESAAMVATGDPVRRRYSFDLTLAGDAPPKGVHRLDGKPIGVLCDVPDHELGKEVRCYYSTRTVRAKVTPVPTP